MPEVLHLPPVAQAVLTITGVVLAVVRLLTASKAFWWRFPAWLQKGLPAFLVALGTLPQALELAKSWLDVATALVFAVGAWFTASRGDQRPVEPSKSKPPVLPVLYLFALAVFVSVQPWITGCSSDRSRDIKTAIDGARAACLVYGATKAQLPKPVPEADELCPLLLAQDALPEPVPSAVAAGGAAH